MLFNSIEFFAFLPIVFLLYWFVFRQNLNAQNLLILISSYVFYGWWDWRFLSLIILSSLVDYSIGLKIEGTPAIKKKKVLLALSLIVNLGILGVFKYFNFFQGEFIKLFEAIGYRIDPWSLQIILPVGISFYTFQTLSYTIDVYRGEIKATKKIIEFMAFVSFFPQLVAGPIERARKLLPQFSKSRTFDSKVAKDGLRQMLWGFFKKVAVADNCASFVQEIFESPSDFSQISLAVAVFLFAIQIYCDFSGYSDIAIGCAKLFGFHLSTNFAFPYFSRDIAEFWRRWHISLSSWFRDYLYIPLGGSKGHRLIQFRNVLIVFVVSGFWHGANWTFVIWGILHALFFIPLMLLNRNRKHLDTVSLNRTFPEIKEAFQMILTFTIVCFAWIFFRAVSISHALQYLDALISFDLSTNRRLPGITIFVLIGVLFTVEWINRKYEFGLMLSKLTTYQRWFIYYAILAILWVVLPEDEVDFIYFQF